MSFQYFLGADGVVSEVARGDIDAGFFDHYDGITRLDEVDFSFVRELFPVLFADFSMVEAVLSHTCLRMSQIFPATCSHFSE